MEGLYNKENLFAEFAMQKTKAKKVFYIKSEFGNSNSWLFPTKLDCVVGIFIGLTAIYINYNMELIRDYKHLTKSYTKKIKNSRKSKRRRKIQSNWN